MIEFKKSRKKSLQAFEDVDEKKSSFGKAPLHSQNKPHDGEHYYYARKLGIRHQHNKYGRFQNSFQYNRRRKFQCGSSAKTR